MANFTSQHILGTSANLLGFCLFVITSLHVMEKTETYFIDEITSVVSTILVISCIFSFISIRTQKGKMEKRYETIAEYMFFAALLGILAVILLITFHFLK